MVRRLSLLAAMMVVTLGIVSGCEGLRHAIRSNGNDEAWKAASAPSKSNDGVETEPTKIQAVDADARNPKPFFQNNRSSGAWSSEAREIEGHLGVGP
jgi:hypothetical protein